MTTPTISVGAKQQIIKILREQGYPRYAKLVSLFDIYLTDDPNVIGYMVPGKARIVLNEGLNIYQVSVIVRHEVLHEFFTHYERQVAFDSAHKELGSNHELANIAADYEISNRGYTSDDKANVRSIKLNGKLLSGLVTEDHYPEWKGLSFEEMYEKLLKEQQTNEEALKDLLDQLKKVSGKSLEDLDDLLDKMSDAADDAEDDSSTSSSGVRESTYAGEDKEVLPSGSKSSSDESEASAEGKKIDRKSVV